MKKSGLDEFLSSIFRDHIDSKNSEVLLKKKDAEKNVDKLIQLINEEDTNLPSLNLLQKSELVDIIKNVQEGYRDLFDCYDRLAENLKENIQQRDSTGTFRLSSDTEPSDSEPELPIKEKSEDYISSKDHRVLQEQIQSAKVVQVLEHKLQSMNNNFKFPEEENIVLEKENRAMEEQLLDANKKSELQNANILQFESPNADLEEVNIKNTTLEDRFQNMTGSAKALEEENRDLKQNLQASFIEGDKLKQTIENIREQNEALVLENKEVASKLLEAEKFTEELKIDMQQMKDKLADLESHNMSLKQECNDKVQELAYLNQQLNSIIKDHEELKSQNSEIISKNQEVQRSLIEARDQAIVEQKVGEQVFSTRITQLSSENENWKSEIHNLQQKLADEEKRFSMELDEAKSKHSLTYKELNIELENTKKEVDKLEEKLEATNNENESCHVLIEKLGRDLQATNLQLCETNDELESEIEQVKRLKSENSRLLSEIDSRGKEQMEVLNELERVKEDYFLLEEEKDKLLEAANNSSSEIKKLNIDNQQLEVKVKQLEAVVETENSNVEKLREEKRVMEQNNRGIHDIKSDLEKELEAEKLRVSVLEARWKVDQNEAVARIQTVTADRDDFLVRLQSMNQQNNKLQDQMKVVADICLKNQTLVEECESKVLSRISDHEVILENLKDQCRQLLIDCKHLRDLLQEYSKKLEIMESFNEGQSKEINRLADNRAELAKKLKQSETEKAEIIKDFSKLQGHTEALEVVHRLSSQCLHVTQAENKEIEEKLKEKSKELESLSGKLGFLQNERRSVEAILNSKVSEFCAELGNMEILFGKNHQNLEKRLSTSIKELETMKTSVEKQLVKKYTAVDQPPELTSKLKAYEDALTVLLAEKKEVEKLETSMAESNQRLELKEKQLKEMQEEMEALGNEKMEAIKQLCLQIEYHRENAEFYRGLHMSKTLPVQSGR